MKHRKLLLGAFSSLVACFFSNPSLAQESSTVIPFCLNAGENFQEPLVANSDTAKKIHMAIVSALFPDRVKDFHSIVVVQEHNSWVVSQERKPYEVRELRSKSRPRKGEENSPPPLVVTLGSGQISMKVNKCNGAISEMTVSK